MLQTNKQSSNDRSRWCRLLREFQFLSNLLDDACNFNHKLFISTVEWFISMRYPTLLQTEKNVLDTEITNNKDCTFCQSVIFQHGQESCHLLFQLLLAGICCLVSKRRKETTDWFTENTMNHYADMIIMDFVLFGATCSKSVSPPSDITSTSSSSLPCSWEQQCVL